MLESRGIEQRLDTTAERVRFVDVGLDQIRLAVADLATTVDKLNHALQELERRSDELAAQVRGVVETQQAIVERHQGLIEMANVQGRTLDLVFGPTGRYRTRFVGEDDLSAAVAELEFTDRAEDAEAAVHQAFRLLLEIELRCVGRFAGSTPNILAKLAAVFLLDAPSGEVLEIGTLFGLGSVGVARQLSRMGRDYHITVIDPFAGYQIQPGHDESIDVSLTPVSQRVVETNFALGGVPADRYRLIEGMSADPVARAVAADRRYGIVLIDGDHAEEMAYEDLCWVEEVVAPGGVVLLDDFGDQAWPGVATALERYLARDDAQLHLLGVAATCAFLRAEPADSAGTDAPVGRVAAEDAATSLSRAEDDA